MLGQTRSGQTERKWSDRKWLDGQEVIRQTGSDRQEVVIPVGAGAYAGRRVTLGVVLHGAGRVTPELRQIGRELEDLVDGADEDVTGALVHRQVCEGGVGAPVHHRLLLGAPQHRTRTQGAEQEQQGGGRAEHGAGRGGGAEERNKMEERPGWSQF